MDEELRQRRIRLNIPVHETDDQHKFVDGYCTCGEARKQRTEWPRNANHNHNGIRNKVNLSTIEGSVDNR